ncbi:MAG: hypothetical protein PW788_15275 [Micavibrio sp.]|nr:hypothetical protein [Micavibrio sp.]
MKNSKTYIIAAGVALLLVTTAGASVYLTKQSLLPQTASSHSSRKQTSDIVWNDRVVAEKRAQAVPACDDGNIAGKAVGGVGGGVLGSLAGKGHGKTATTIAGTLGGAYLGGEAIPLKNVTCAK